MSLALSAASKFKMFSNFQIHVIFSLIYIKLCMIIFAHLAHGHGYANFAQGAKATAMGGAFTAIADDPSANYYNPAGIAFLHDTQIMIGSTFFTSNNAEFESSGNSQMPEIGQGSTFKLKNDTNMLPFLHMTHSLPDGFAIGISGYSMWGHKNDWPDHWEGRFTPGGLENEIKSYRTQAVLAYAPNDAFALSGGIFQEWLDLSMSQNVWAQMLMTEFDYSIEGNNDGTGWTAGLLIRPQEQISLGASYRSGVRHKIDSLDIKISPDIPMLGIEDTEGSLVFTTPGVFNVGTAIKFEKLTLAFDIYWTEWSKQDVLKIKYNKKILGNTQNILDKRWKNSFTYGFGAEYAFSEFLKLRTGYIYDESPVPSDTLDPTVFSGDSQLFCIGIGITHGDFQGDVSYSRIISEGRRFDNAAGDFPNPGGQRVVGEFKDSSGDIFILGISYIF